MRNSYRVAGLMLLGALAVVAANVSAQGKKESAPKRSLEQPHLPTHAVAVLVPTQGNEVRGVIMFDHKDGALHVHGEVRGLEPGSHGFHIHEFGDLRDPKAESAGSHFNPHMKEHGGVEGDERHDGDLGNIEADEDGVAKVDVRVKKLELHFVIGRSIVVHAGKDDLKSQPSGDSGARVAAGVIGIAKSEMSGAKKSK